MPANEEVVRKLANQIWESEGRPDGQADRHWKQALILSENKSDAQDISLKRSVDPSEKQGPTEPAQPDQT